MIQIIAGEKGKGKTKYLLEKVNESVKSATGNIVYLDKSQKHMYELSNKVRLINVADYVISNCDEFLGFLCGIISQDHDLEEMYLDSFLTIAKMDDSDLVHAIEKLETISEKFHVDFVLSISRNESDLPECTKGQGNCFTIILICNYKGTDIVTEKGVIGLMHGNSLSSIFKLRSWNGCARRHCRDIGRQFLQYHRQSG